MQDPTPNPTLHPSLHFSHDTLQQVQLREGEVPRGPLGRLFLGQECSKRGIGSQQGAAKRDASSTHSAPQVQPPGGHLQPSLQTGQGIGAICRCIGGREVQIASV